QEPLAPWSVRFSPVTVTRNGHPINGIDFFVPVIGISLVMLNVHGVVQRLRETAGNGLCGSKNAIQSLGAKERIVNEVVPHSVDVRIHHQRVNESENQHHPRRRMRIEEKQSNEVSQMK